MAELQQTVGKVRVEGIVVGFNPSDEKTYKEGESKKNKDYKTVNLVVKTNDNNVIYDLGLYGEVKDTVKLYGKIDGEKQKLEVKFDERNSRPDGFTCFGFGTVRTGLVKENDGKIKMKNYFNYDGAELIRDNLKDGDSIWIDATFNPSNYQKDGEDKIYVKYNIEGIGLKKDPIDFTQEGYEEVASFEQEFVVTGHAYIKETKKFFIYGRLISFDKSWKNIIFNVDVNKYPTLAENIMKKTKFGDVLTVQGVIRSGTETIVVEQPKPAFDWGGETPAGQGKANKGSSIKELQITTVTSHKPKVYKEEDFISTNPFDQNKSEQTNEVPFGEENNSSNKNPFDD